MPLFPQHTGRTSAAPLSGTTSSSLLKRYRPLETRAAGGFGSVEICLDARLQRRVAIKRMPLMAESGMSATAVEAALAEARTASMLQHPHIVSVIDFTFDSQYAYLVMEYVDGMSLQEFLERVDGHSLTFDEAACIADALGQALTFAHENGVLHLDIKPANVLIDRNGHVKLTDFGMATLSAAAGFGGARGGTIGYMPPEQLNNEEVSQQTDIFALACVLYESLCGTGPFRAGTPADSMDRIIKGVVYPGDLLPNMPELSEDALVSALSPMPRDRPASVAAFCDRFLARLGSPREGRRSLAAMIAQLTAAEEETAPEETAGVSAERAWELDPARGYLGSRYDRARDAVVSAVCGLSTAYASYLVLAAMGVTGVAAPLSAAAIGAAAAIAPQIGSALTVTGLLVLTCNATASAAGVLSAIPVTVVLFALAAGWWLVWGRTEPPASAASTLAIALGHGHGASAAALLGGVTISPWAASVPVAFAAYFLPPQTAAVSCAFGLVAARLFAAATAAGGVLTASGAVSALAAPTFLMQTLLAAGGAAATSWLLERGWERYSDSQGTGGLIAACIVAATAGALSAGLANPMEIASLTATSALGIASAGLISSIIVGICLYLLGYEKEPSEGDRS